LPRKLAEDFVEAIKLLRAPDFQRLLTEYQRKPKVFYVAYGTQDQVESEWLIRDGAGNQYKPEDYLAAFARFVQENPARIDAIRILLDRPQEWGTDALGELRQKLSAARERFTEDLLRRAHEARYQKALVDIISMVKHAAREQEPLLTAGERVDRAFAKLTAGQTFTDEQRKWLDRIREHLVANLTIGKDDFDLVPIFSREGGWACASRAFNGNLTVVLSQLNEAVAA